MENQQKVITLGALGKYDNLRPQVQPVKATYKEMTEMRDQGKLIPGQLYRITDFVTTVDEAVEPNARSAGHPFDVLVRADSASTLNEQAWAVRHDGDTYFNSARLESWELRYRLDNILWSSSNEGKGTITWMKDEYGNECPYDFKNVQFKRWKATDRMNRQGLNGQYIVTTLTRLPSSLSVEDEEDFIWAYTFSSNSDGGEQTDYSLASDNMVHDVVIRKYEENLDVKLNNITLYGRANFDISFDSNCHNICIGYNCHYLDFGKNCGDVYVSNVSSTLTFTSDCHYITFGQHCVTCSFGETNGFIDLPSESRDIELGNDNNYISFPSGCRNISIADGSSYIDIVGNYTQYVQILEGVKGSYTNHLTLEFATNKTYTQVAGLNSNGGVKIWVPADLAALLS